MADPTTSTEPTPEEAQTQATFENARDKSALLVKALQDKYGKSDVTDTQIANFNASMGNALTVSDVHDGIQGILQKLVDRHPQNEIQTFCDDILGDADTTGKITGGIPNPTSHDQLAQATNNPRKYVGEKLSDKSTMIGSALGLAGIIGLLKGISSGNLTSLTVGVGGLLACYELMTGGGVKDIARDFAKGVSTGVQGVGSAVQEVWNHHTLGGSLSH